MLQQGHRAVQPPHEGDSQRGDTGAVEERRAAVHDDARPLLAGLQVGLVGPNLVPSPAGVDAGGQPADEPAVGDGPARKREPRRVESGPRVAVQRAPGPQEPYFGPY